MAMTDREIMCALIGQVSLAAHGGVETSVRTIITRPMWNAFCRAVGNPEDSEPTEWLGIKDTLRVYGSETIVIDHPEMASISFRP